MSTEIPPLHARSTRPLVERDMEQASKQRPKATRKGQRLKLVEMLLEVSRCMASYDNLDDILHALVDMTTREIGGERGSLFLNDPSTNELYARVAQGNLNFNIVVDANGRLGGSMSVAGTFRSRVAICWRAEAKTTGKSSCASSAPSS